MRYYNDPTIKDVITEMETVQKQLDELKPRMMTAEHLAQIAGWASLKSDIDELKEALQSISDRLTKAGL